MFPVLDLTSKRLYNSLTAYKHTQTLNTFDHTQQMPAAAFNGKYDWSHTCKHCSTAIASMHDQGAAVKTFARKSNVINCVQANARQRKFASHCNDCTGWLPHSI